MTMIKVPALGLRQNAGQFTLLVIVNAFVGGMIGLERSILPAMAEQEFHIAAASAILSFIIVFGIVKALSNYLAGSLANKIGRKNLLILGWIFAIPVPFILMWAGSWHWIIFANALLGINQGLAWSSTVVMKIDLVGEKQRGLAMGINEFAGYLAVAAVAFFTSWIADTYGVRPYPFYLGIALSFAGLLMSILFIRDTRHHVAAEKVQSQIPKLQNIFRATTFTDRNLSSVTQAGLINNLNDGMTWGLLPMILAARGFGLGDIGIITAIYPAVWGLGQLYTGKMSDKFCKKSMLSWGMFAQGISLLLLIFAHSYTQFILLSVLLGLGTTMVYPTFLSTIAENTHPDDRAKSIGVFRLWRDLGYAIGALITGILTDMFGMNTSVAVIGLLTLGSALVIEKRMYCRIHAPKLTDWLFRKKTCSSVKNKPASEFNARPQTILKLTS